MAPRATGEDPELAFGDELDVRFLQAWQANKRYVCPGCNQAIEARTAHYVVVPRHDPDLRRHWHRACWLRRPSARGR